MALGRLRIAKERRGRISATDVDDIATELGMVAGVEVTDRVAPGQLFMDFHFPDTLANALTSDVSDEFTSCPEYKVTAVAVRPAG